LFSFYAPKEYDDEPMFIVVFFFVFVTQKRQRLVDTHHPFVFFCLRAPREHDNEHQLVVIFSSFDGLQTITSGLGLSSSFSSLLKK
jgi:hypothetical protein